MKRQEQRITNRQRKRINQKLWRVKHSGIDIREERRPIAEGRCPEWHLSGQNLLTRFQQQWKSVCPGIPTEQGSTRKKAFEMQEQTGASIKQTHTQRVTIGRMFQHASTDRDCLNAFAQTRLPISRLEKRTISSLSSGMVKAFTYSANNPRPHRS